MQIKMKVSGQFNGAKTKKAYRFSEGDVLTVDAADIKHIVPADYSEVKSDEAAKGTPEKKDK